MFTCLLFISKYIITCTLSTNKQYDHQKSEAKRIKKEPPTSAADSYETILYLTYSRIVVGNEQIHSIHISKYDK